MTAIYQKNTHFHITTGEIWDLESMQDIMRDVIAPYSVSRGNCNIVLDLSQLSERHLYNKAFLLSVQRFIDNIYGIKTTVLVIKNPDQLKWIEKTLNQLAKSSTYKGSYWALADSYSAAQSAVVRGE